jgi:Spy/CpxP family protein refolding chaperone
MKEQIIWVAAICLFANLAMAQTTRPAGERGQRLGQRIQALMSQLDLTDDQKQKVNDIIQQGKEDFQKAMPELRDATPEQRRAKVQEIFEGMRDEIGDILTPEQKQKLQQLMKQRQADNPQTANTDDRPKRSAALLNRKDLDLPATRPAQHTVLEEHPTKPMEDGQTAPDVALHWMNGDAVHLSTFKGRVIVLVFGSYSTPAFRDKASALPKIADSYNNRAKFVLVYTKEAHPSDGWTVERNKHDDVEIAQPTDLAGRKAAAQQAVTALHLTNIPVAIDSMDDAAANAYGAFPDGVIIIGKNGKIVARQHWLEPTALPVMIDQALKN